MPETSSNMPIRQDRAKLYQYANGDSFHGKPTSEVFSAIFQGKVWDGKTPESSVSGSGSSMQQTQTILQALPALLEKYQVSTFLDVPCGDANWIQKLDWQHRHYIGADIVAPLIAENKAKYKNNGSAFIHLNLLQDLLPDADMMLCRDCLVHFSFEDIRRAVDNIKASNITYLLTTTFPEQTLHEDITTGGWRPINLQKPPFNFPEPLAIINEHCTEMNGAFRDKSLGLWRVADL